MTHFAPDARRGAARRGTPERSLLKLSEYFAPTLREVPAEAEIPSHQLLLRGGFARKLGAGVYSYLPLGWRVLRKLEAVLRLEMDAIGCGEMRMPTLVPRELMEETGRWDIDVVYKLRDRRDAEFALGFTHEEVITDIARRELRSWRDLPVLLYQVQTKFRDEPRPRGGLIRTREFIMFDAYSFDRDDEGMDRSYQRLKAAYERFFTRIGLPTLVVEADGGAIGDLDNHEFVTLSESGEDTVLRCDACGYAANAEKCPVPAPPAPAHPVSEKPLELVATPGARTIDEVAATLGAEPRHLVKSLIYVTDDATPVLVLVRGDRTVNEIKLQRLLDARAVALADEATVRRITGAAPGFAGPLGVLNTRLIADHEIAGMRNFIAGANQDDTHYVHVNLGRDFTPTEFADIRLAEDGDSCPNCVGGTLHTTRGIEVGHIFKLGAKYSKAMGAEFTDASSSLSPILMGCYGIGMTRTLAALIETHHDANGIVWPATIAPFAVQLIVASSQDATQQEAARTLYAALTARGIDVLLDDRDERPGVKFKDADLVGCPLRVVVGKGLASGELELRLRRDPASTQTIPVATAADEIDAQLAALRAELQP
jgi:prolyl-tRNA synthetase